MLIKHKVLCLLTAAFIILIDMFGFVSCRHDPFFISEMDTICFEEQILPVLQNSCGISGCHDGAGESEDFDATDYTSVIKSVTPGDVYASKLYQVITDIWGENMMPPDRPLTIEQRTAIHIWIAQGAKHTSCSVPPPDTSGNGNNGNGNGGNHLPDDTICFVQDILPIFSSSCAITDCHDAATHEDGYTLTNYTTITGNPGSIVPFQPDESKIYKVVTENEEDDRMPPPPRQALTSEQIQKLRKWILEGALNSSCPVSDCDTTGIVGFSTHVQPVLQTYCLSCHNSVFASGDVILDNYDGVKTWSDFEINGIPDLIGVIRQFEGFTPMPPDGSKMSDCDARQIEIWIEQGKLNN